ncbi:hypothetical protein CHH80_21795 [Bacillus sp. 7504-2]|nr:hypothetical protein CHH80_21795 [Bacillus sp. 7504-2]
MRIKSYVLAIILLLGISVIAACSEKKESDTAEKNVLVEQEESDEESDSASIQELIAELPEPSTTVEELINAEPGEYSGKKFVDLTVEEKNEVVSLFKEFPKLGEEPTEEEIELYWRKMLSLLHEDYPNPAEALDVVKIESFGSPELEDERFHFKEQLNVQIILDASGSMGNVIDGKTMMNIAKESIMEFAASLPEGANIALRVYGHKGTGKEKDKELSCSSNELIYNMQAYEQNALQQALSGVNPAGWTPLASALEQAKHDLSQYKSESNTNIIYLVSDGIETCNGDPVAKAKELAASNIQPIVNVIGFDVDSKGQQQLKAVAEAAKGIYENARNAADLKQQFQKAKDIADKWQQWKEKAINTANSNKLDQFLKNIPAYHIEWMDANGNEWENIPELLRLLQDEGQISKAAYQILYDKKKERFNNNMELGKQLEKDLQALAEKNFEDAEKEIYEIYRNNVENTDQ